MDTSSLHNTLEIGSLSSKGVLFLASRGNIFTIFDKDINDKSKADYFAKGLVSLQVLWFTGDIIQQKFADLPITLLPFWNFIRFVTIGC